MIAKLVCSIFPGTRGSGQWLWPEVTSRAGVDQLMQSAKFLHEPSSGSLGDCLLDVDLALTAAGTSIPSLSWKACPPDRDAL